MERNHATGNSVTETKGERSAGNPHSANLPLQSQLVARQNVSRGETVAVHSLRPTV